MVQSKTVQCWRLMPFLANAQADKRGCVKKLQPIQLCELPFHSKYQHAA